MEHFESQKEKRKEGRTILLIIAIFLMIVAAGIVIFLKFYNSYIDQILYRERLKQMQEVTTQLFSGLEDVVQTQWNATNIYNNYIETGKPQTTEELLNFMQKQVRLNELDVSDSNLIAVDSSGRYLTQDGWQGMLSGMDYLVGYPDQANFVEKSMTTNETYMYFLKRLEEPITVQEEDKTFSIIYYGSAHSMTELDPYFSCEAYDDSNSVYVLDSQGMRLFRSSSSSSKGGSLRGFNAYSTLQEMDYLHNTSFEEAKKELDANGVAYSNAVLDGTEYYYALYKMDQAEWTLLFLVPSSYVATNVVTLVNITVKLVLVFAVVLVVVSSVMLFVILRIQQKKAVEKERENNELLQKANSKLSAAVDLAEHAEEEAKAANKAKSDFLANMSHDIRTPMNAIVGITNLLEHEEDNPERLHSYIQKVQNSSQHLLSLINDVLDMSKIESSGVSLNQESVSLAEQVAQVESIIRPQTQERGQSFMIRVHEIAHEYVIGDGVRLRQILINLLSNALKYTPYGGKIRLDFAELPCEMPDYARISITVTDNGYGMQPEFVEHIFEPFTRAESSTTNKVQGTGLGMAITKNIVDLMGGSIQVHSEPGKGSSFEVVLTLPIDENMETGINAENVLLISDDEILIRNMNASMSETDAQLTVVSTKEKALEVLQEKYIDVVLLAGYLHHGELPQYVSEIKETSKDTVLLFCCDYVQQDQEYDELLRSGADGVICRPFFLSNFAHAINQACADEGQSADAEGATLSGRRFLCAEDNSLNAEILEALLDMNNATCVIYPDGAELVKAFENVKPGEFDAILMDIQMPNMNGLEATKIIRNGHNPLGKTIPIIAMTANAFSSDVQNCLDAGMNAHIAKPIDIGLLEKTLQNFGGGR